MVEKSPWGQRYILHKALGQRARALQKQSCKDHKVPSLAGEAGHKGAVEAGIMSGSKDEDIRPRN